VQTVNEQRVLREEAEYRLLTSFIYGLRGEAGRELWICNPETLDQALNMATIIHNAKKMEHCQRRYDTFTVRTQDRDYTDFKESKPKWRQGSPQQPRPLPRHPPERKERNRDQVRPWITCFSCGQPGHMARNCEAGGKPTTKREQHSPN
jgi:hypothetical protein